MLYCTSVFDIRWDRFRTPYDTHWTIVRHFFNNYFIIVLSLMEDVCFCIDPELIYLSNKVNVGWWCGDDADTDGDDNSYYVCESRICTQESSYSSNRQIHYCNIIKIILSCLYLSNLHMHVFCIECSYLLSLVTG